MNYKFYDLEFIKTIHFFVYDNLFSRLLGLVFFPFMVYFICTNIFFSVFIMKDNPEEQYGYYTTLCPMILGNVFFLVISLVQLYNDPT